MATTRAMPIVKYLRQLGDEIENSDSWLDQARDSTDAINEAQAFVKRMAAVKVAAIRALYAEGWTGTQIAREIGISRARVEQLINR